MELSWLQEWQVIFQLPRQTWYSWWMECNSFLSFPYLWEQSGQHILIRIWLALWAGGTSLHMTVSEAKHFCNVKISSESLLCALRSCLQLSSWHCVLLPVRTESQRVTNSVYCCKMKALCIDNAIILLWIPLCTVFHLFVLLPNSSLWSLFFTLLCSWCVTFSGIFVFFSQPLLQLPLNLHFCCIYVYACVLSVFSLLSLCS